MSGTSDAGPLLLAHGLTKHYAVPVLRDVDFQLRAGEIHALVGANGAGKSTLCRIIAGLVPATRGRMLLRGTPYRPANKGQAERQGVQIVQQELNLIPTLSVAENLWLNRLPHRFGLLRTGRLHQMARDALAHVALEQINPQTPVVQLGIGQQQLIEIAAALARRCQLLILDEPTAALTPTEIDQLFEQLRQLRGRGVGIVYVSHRLDEIQQLADRVTVLRDGQRVETLAAAQASSERLVQLMTGRMLDVAPAGRQTRRDGIALRVDGLTRGTAVRDVSFSVRQGERFGLAGLVGSGRTELLRAIYGADPADAGSIWVPGMSRPRRLRHPRQAIAAGLALVPEDRKADGLLLSQPLRSNASLASLSRFAARWGWIDQRSERRAAERLLRQMDIRCRGVEQPVEQLSGGNQQKVVVGRWLLREPTVWLLDEPTRGIDVAARARLYQLLDELTRQGKALVIVSSDLDELIALCDRIGVMSAGRMAAIFEADSWSRDQILAAAFSGYLNSRFQEHRQ